MVKRIAITAGEPAGIGPDITLALCSSELVDHCVIIADKNMLAERADQLQIPTAQFSKLTIEHIPLPSNVTLGKPNPEHASAILDTIKTAALGCKEKQFAAMVTGPVHKSAINDAGIAFQGHTEFLADLFQVKKTVMLFYAKPLKMALLTTHHPLADVPSLITPELILETVRIIDDSSRTLLNMASPHLVFCGLNPHAGESGYLGHEEQDILIPAISQCQQSGFNVSGPFAADTLFRPEQHDQNTIILSLYHDQGLPAMKALFFNTLTNVTLGLPIIRTSVDHGSALSLAGSGQACANSLLCAIHSAMLFSEPSAAHSFKE